MSSLEDIATRAGVSSRTVARVLRGDLRESWASTAARAERIRQIAHEMGYRTNSSARAIRSGRFSCVGLLLSSLDGRSHLPDTLLDGIHDALNDHGYHLTLGRLPDDELVQAEAFPKILREWCCDGLLVNYTDRIPEGMLRHLHEQDVPSVWLNCPLGRNCVSYDDQGAGEALTRRMLAVGHQKIGYVDFTEHRGGGAVHYSRADRYAGYCRAMRGAGLTPMAQAYFAGTPVDAQLPALCRWLGAPVAERPTAVVTYDAGYQVILAAARQGLGVPGDLTVGTFSTQPPEATDRTLGINLAAMHLPTREAGQVAVDSLLARMADAAGHVEPVVLAATFWPGQTFGAPGDR